MDNSDKIRIITDRDLPLKGKSVLTVGAFDGVHIGHACLIKAMCSVSREKESEGIVWTFAQTPKSVYNKNIKHITGSVEKMRELEKLGARGIYFADFEAIKDKSPEEFVNEILIGQFHADTVVCGFDFRFGANRNANAQTLKRLLNEKGAHCMIMPPLKIGDETVSSTLIREKLANGDIEGASYMLGRRYGFELPVIHGRRLGRTIGFPTINQRFPDYRAVPAYGVYACLCEIDGKTYRGIANIGVRPTVSEHEDAPLCETHIFDFSKDMYDRDVKIFLCRRIREERKFDSVESLKNQICEDEKKVCEYFKTC